jgi:hypothetical protein
VNFPDPQHGGAEVPGGYPPDHGYVSKGIGTAAPGEILYGVWADGGGESAVFDRSIEEPPLAYRW